MLGNDWGGGCGRRHTSVLMFAEGFRIWVEGEADLLLLLRIWGETVRGDTVAQWLAPPPLAASHNNWTRALIRSLGSVFSLPGFN